jgi:hypothetical protein
MYIRVQRFSQLGSSRPLTVAIVILRHIYIKKNLMPISNPNKKIVKNLMRKKLSWKKREKIPLINI